MYQEINFNIRGLKGFSERQVSEHLKLYSGYVKNFNSLSEKITAIEQSPEADNYILAELRRRLGFEFNGMRLHEYYFESLNSIQGDANLLAEAIKNEFGSIDNWSKNFKTAGLMRGIGWVLLCHDPKQNKLINIWVTDHEIGHLAGLPIIIAMDVWEHAFLLDYLPSQRKEYIESFFENLDWQTLEERFKKSVL